MYTTSILLKIKILLSNTKKKQNISLNKLKKLKYKSILNKKIKKLNIKLKKFTKTNCKILKLSPQEETTNDKLLFKQKKLNKDPNILVLQKRFDAILKEVSNKKQ